VKIAYALAGEGRGHTTRAITLASGLMELGHEVRFFTSGDAQGLLEQTFGAGAVEPLDMPRFVIFRKRVSYIGTFLATLGFVFRHPQRKRRTVNALRTWGADALISDFEPTFSGVSKRLRLPLISFNSQRFSLDASLKHVLNRRQRLKLIPIQLMCRVFAPRPDLSLVSKGFHLKANKPSAHLLGPMLRPEFINTTWSPNGTHIIAYLRPSVAHHLPALAHHANAHGLRVKLYGHHPPQVPDNVDCCPISNDAFLNDLFRADWMVQTAGTQLLGEAACLGIPSLCFPEPGQVEQEINGTLAMHAHPNIRVISSSATQPESLDAVLFELRQAGPPPEFENGCEQAVALTQSFLQTRCMGQEESSIKNGEKANTSRDGMFPEGLSTAQHTPGS
jgi:uncharacterized protein (TIGR00661 family)